jgi:hypothetical protein
MSEYVYANTASQTIDIFLQDSSSSTGQGLSGLVFNSAGLVASYRKGATGSRTAITLATQTVGGAYSSGGFVEIDATNMKGVYRLDLPNAAVDTEGFVTLYLYGATNLLPTALRIDCRPLPVDVKKVDTQTASASAGVTFPASIASPTNITAATGVTLAAVTHTGAVIPTVSNVTDGVTLAATQPAITFGAVTIDVSGSTPNITLTGSGSGNGIEWTRSGSGNPLDVDVVDQIQSGLSTEVAAIKTKTDQLTFTTPNKVDSTAELDSAARVKLHGTQDDYAPLKSSDYTAPLTAAATRTALGMSAADLDTQLDAILAAASAGAGTGARLVTITVNDGTTVLQNAVVRLTEGGNTYRALTNVSGVATFNVDDATYAVAISKVGYSYAGTTIVVNGVETATYSMTAINVTPGSGDLTTGYLTCLDELGAAEANVAVRCQLVQVPTSGTGYAYDSTVQIDTSAANGLVEFPMIKGARYLVWRGAIKPPEGIAPILISASAGSTTALGSLIGP